MTELLKNCAEKLNIPLSDTQLEQFLLYKELLLEWNEKINLTAITQEDEIAIKHFADCITPLLFRDFKGKSVIDVGTGAGFPGLPVKIACPQVKLTLLDSLNKRINFLCQVVEALGLENVNCIHSRAEDGGRDDTLREAFDVCVSRAVAPLNVLAEYDLPFVKVGGELIALKGKAAMEEICQGEKAISLLGGEISQVKDITLPFSDITHTLVFVQKIKHTPDKYPRKAGKITKSPII